MFVLLVKAVIWAFGAYWCVVIIRRFPEDVRELCELKQTVRRGAIIFVWFLTVIIALTLVYFTKPVLAGILNAIRGML